MIQELPPYAFWIIGASALAGAAFDYRTDRIPNLLSLPALGFGVALAAFTGKAAVIASLSGVGIAAAVFIPLFLLKIMGAGDGKLAMAIASVLGATSTLEFIAASILVGGLASLVLLVVQGRVRAFFTALWGSFRSILTPGLAVQWPKLSTTSRAPFGIALFCGYLFVALRFA